MEEESIESSLWWRSDFTLSVQWDFESMIHPGRHGNKFFEMFSEMTVADGAPSPCSFVSPHPQGTPSPTGPILLSFSFRSLTLFSLFQELNLGRREEYDVLDRRGGLDPEMGGKPVGPCCFCVCVSVCV